jgi:glutamate synthase (NADPH/NADH) small chain
VILRSSAAHEEGGERVYAVNTERFVGNQAGELTGLRGHEVSFADGRFVKVDGSDFELDCDLVLLAMGFLGPEQGPLLNDLGVELTDRGTVARNADFTSTVDGVFVTGDMGRGQSLIVWAIAEGRSAAAAVDRWLTGSSTLPAPILPTTVAQR